MSDHRPPEEPPGSLPPPPDEGGRPTLPTDPEGMQPVAPHEAGAVASTRRSRVATIALLVAGAVLLIGAAGAAGAYFSLRGSSEKVLDKVPSGADAVVVAHLDPAASQKMNLFRMASTFPDLGTEDQLKQKLDAMLDDALHGSGLTHDDLGWVGGEVGGYVAIDGGAPSYAVLIASDDDGAASNTLQKLRDSTGSPYTQSSIDGVQVWTPASSSEPTTAIVDGTVVLASDRDAMQAVIQTDHGAPSIQDDQTFTTVMGHLPGDNLGFAYVNVHALTSLASLVPGQTGGAETQLAAYQGAAYSVSAEPNGLAVDAAVTTDPSKLTDAQREALGAGPNPLLDLTPSNAFAVIAAAGVGQELENSLTQISQLDARSARTIAGLGLIGPDGVLQHLTGDVGLEVGPGSGLLPVSATAMIGVDDAGAVQSWLDTHLPGLLARAGVPGLSARTLRAEDYQGVKITYSTMPTTPVAWGVVNGALVVGLTPNAVEDAVDLSQGTGSSITSDAAFSTAVSDLPGTQSVLFVDVNGILTAVQGILPNDAYRQFLDQGGKNLQPIDTVAAGGAGTETVSTYRVFIRIP